MGAEYKGYTGYHGYTPENHMDWAAYVRQARQHPWGSREYERLYTLAEAAWRDLGRDGQTAALAQAADEAATDSGCYERSLQMGGR